MPQTTSTGNLAKAQRTMIGQMLYTTEHNAPAMALVTRMRLRRGASSVDVPKAGQITVSDLVEGQDITDDQNLGMEFTTLTTSEVGAKVVVTDKLVRQMQPDVFKVIGRQLGDGMARKKDEDVIALYGSLNGGTALGAAGATFNVAHAAAAYTHAVANKFGTKLSIVHHPNALYSIINSGAITPGASGPVDAGWSRDLLQRFFAGLAPVGGVPMFHDGNIEVDSDGDAVGVIADEGALVVLESVTMRTERQRDASLRGTEVVITADYGVFELDDSRGAPLKYDATAPSTSE